MALGVPSNLVEIQNTFFFIYTKVLRTYVRTFHILNFIRVRNFIYFISISLLHKNIYTYTYYIHIYAYNSYTYYIYILRHQAPWSSTSLTFKLVIFPLKLTIKTSMPHRWKIAALRANEDHFDRRLSFQNFPCSFQILILLSTK